MMKYADLHIHTHFSDGTFSPEEAVKAAQASGLACIAITDHDVTSGIGPAQICAADSGIELVAGVELTGEMDNGEVHILGYFIDWQAPWFKQKLEALCALRKDRALAILQKLKQHGITLDRDELLTGAGAGSVGRLHIARLLKKHGFVYSIQDAFSRYIGDEQPCYVQKTNLTPAEVIEMIRRLHGIAVLAHPYTVGNDEFIPELIRMGLRGIEVFYPEHNQVATEHYRKLAEKYGLLITGGSDCHGQGKDETALGAVKIPYILVEQLRKEAEVLRRGQQ